MLTGKRRSLIAIGSAALLTGVGVAVANGVSSPAVPAPSPSATLGTTVDPRAAELERSVTDLLAQVDGLEAAVDASVVPVVPPAPAASASGSASTSGSTAAGDDSAAAPMATAPTSAAQGDDEHRSEDDDREVEDEDDDD